MADANESIAVGIDLGTTHCCVAYVNENGIVEIIANDDGHRTTPSYIVLDETEIRVGKVAKDEFYTNPKNVVYDSKRLIGRKFDDKYIQDDMKNWTFKVKESKNEPIIELSLNGEPVCYKPQEISSMLLVHMKKVAEGYIGKSVNNAVITVPAHFNYHQRTATAEAGKLAGLNVLGIINEPTAAALAYIHKNQIKTDRNILVFDLGGGTFDVSLVQMKSNRTTVAATGGNTHLGGRDFDNNLKNLICKKIIDDYTENCLQSEITNRRIRQATENMKIRLSSINKATLDLQYLHDGKDVELSITREEFEEVNVDLFKSTIDIVQNCLTDANIGKTEIDDIVLVGGSTRIPKLQKMLSEFFDGKTLCKTINPDEAVAYGAAIQTTKFSGNKIEALVSVEDITSLSLGVDVQSQLMSVLIPRNSKIPARATKTFSITGDKVTKVVWDIYEGERSFVLDNVHLGSCTLYIPPKPPGYTVDLTFHVDEDGILEVSTQEKSGRHTSLSIAYEKCDPHVVSDMINEAKANQFSDMVREVIANRRTDIQNYCTKLKAICDYDKKDMSDEDKGVLRNTADKYLNSCKDFSVANGTLLDYIPLKRKYQKIQSICEPIIKKYGYDILDLPWDKFHELVTEEK